MEFVVDLGRSSYQVTVGCGLLTAIGRLARDAGLSPNRCALVTDANVGRLYADVVLQSLRREGFDAALIEIAPGEPSKSFPVLQTIYQRLADAELDRESTVFALGGGVVGDLAGFASDLFARDCAGAGAYLDDRAGRFRARWQNRS